jgi:hypothetical protein
MLDASDEPDTDIKLFEHRKGHERFHRSGHRSLHFNSDAATIHRDQQSDARDQQKAAVDGPLR